MITKEKIEALVRKAIEHTDIFITGIDVKSGNRIFVFLDGDRGVSIDDCVEISRFIEASLDRNVEDFELQVSSHGLSSPLVLPRQFVKNIGKEVTVLMHDGRKLTGEILSADDVQFVLQEKKQKMKQNDGNNQSLTVKYSETKQVKLNISFK